MGTSQHKVVRVVGRAQRPAVRRQRRVAMILAVIVGFVLATAPVSFAEEAPPDAMLETTGGDAGSAEAATTPPPEPTPTTVAPETTATTAEPAASTDTTPTTAAPSEATPDTTGPANEPDQRPTGDIGVLASSPGPAPTAEPVVTKRDGVNGCNGARPTPGSENTNKRLIGGTLEPGGTAIFEISYPVDPEDASGRTTFKILDCVFINDVPVVSYDISVVPNTANYIFSFSLDIPVNAPIGAPYCNVAKTTSAPSTSQASNRKAGPACFIIGGDLRILKVDVSGGSLQNATFSVSCTPPSVPPGTVLPPIIIEGVDQDAMPATVIADGIITIAGPQGTECVITETAPPPGYVLPNPNFVTVTIGVDGPTIRFVNVVAGSPNLRIVKTADAATVSAGSQIGFGISVTNVGDGAATAVTLSDPLPAGTGINWSISPAYSGPGTCAITGAVGTQTLNCSFGDLAVGSAPVTVHVVSATTGATSGTFRNVATTAATNHPPVSDDATVTVLQPSLSILKTADATSVSAGTGIGFGITVANAFGAGTATAVTLSDPLPAGAGIDWSISPAYTGPGTCAITGLVGSETLNCSFGNLAPGASATVHVTSPTTSATSGTFRNVATASSTNHGDVVDDAVVVVNKPALSILKTADATSVNSGSNIGFGITVSNSGAAGTGTATAVTLSDPLPSGTGISWSISPAYAGPGTCSITGTAPTQTLNCSFGDLAPGASATVNVTSATTSATSGTFRNVATASSTNHGDVSDDAVVVVNKPSLSIAKTADSETVNSGSPIGFTVTVANAGPGTATAVTLADPLPSGTGITWSISPAYAGPGSCSISGSPGQTLNCTFGDLASGAIVAVHVSSATTSATSGTFLNTATASSTNHPPVTDDARVVVNKPNLSIVKTADATSVSSGSPIGFTVAVANAGPGTATAVVLNDPLPPAAGVTWSISPSTTGCSISGTAPTQVLNCTFGDLASGASASVHVVSNTTFATSGTLVNTATVSASNHPPVVDGAQVVINRPGLSVTKLADAPSVSSGSPIGFTVTVSNAGPGTAANVVLNDPLPSGTGINWSISPARAGCSITGAVGAQVLGCTFGDMATGASASVHVTSATTAATSGTFTNTATASADNHPPVTGIANVIVNKPNLSVTKTADAASVSSGSPIGFTVTVANAGPGTATGVTLSDPLPSATGVSWSISPAQAGCAITGTAPTQTLNCNFGDLASGASASVHVISATTAATTGTLTNTATAQATNHPPVTGVASVVVNKPNVTITKTADAASVIAGSPIGFTVTVSNAGPGAATNLTVSDPLPGGTGIDWSISPATAGCSITGVAPTQTLNCTVASLASGASLVVHVVSQTTAASVGRFDNVATAKADNHPEVKANATTSVVAPTIVLGAIIERAAPAIIEPAPAPPPPPAPAPVAVATLPRTGTDPLTLVLSGLMLLATGFWFRRWGSQA